MMNKNMVLAFLTAASLFLFSCEKDNVATPGITYQITTATASSIIPAGTMSGNLRWSAGYASVAELEFEAKSQTVEIEYKSEAKQKIDLFSPLSSLGVIVIPTGTYEDIEFEIEVQPNGSDAALYLSGNFISSTGVNTPILLTVKEAIEIESKKENITITNGSILSATTTLNLSLIANGVNESMLNNAIRTNGTIILSSTSNSATYEIMLRNLKTCGGVKIEG